MPKGKRSISPETAAEIRVSIKKAARKVREIKRSKPEQQPGAFLWQF